MTATKRQIREIKNFMCDFSESDKRIITDLVISGKIDLGVKIKKMEMIDEEMKGKTPLEIIRKVAGTFSPNRPYYYEDESGLLMSIGRDGIKDMVRRGIDRLVNQIVEIPREKLPPRLQEGLKLAEKIDKEIEEQRKNYAKRTTIIQVPTIPEGNYDDYTEARNQTI